jgi:predicted DNA-binding protein (UPF0278 family)
MEAHSELHQAPLRARLGQRAVDRVRERRRRLLRVRHDLRKSHVEVRAMITAKHAIITPVCRQKGDMEAFEEAVERLREQYRQSVTSWGDLANYHVKLEVERLSREN